MIQPASSLFLQRCLRHAESRPSHKAVISAAVELDYTQLAQRIGTGAGYLQGHGVGPQATVGVAIADEVEHLVATLSLLAVGARQIALGSYESPAMRADLAQRVGLTHLLRGGRDKGDVPCVHDIPWPGAACAPERETIAHDGATVLLRTSGTTAQPNIIAFHERELALQAERDPGYAGDRLLRLASIEHNNSRRHRLYCVWNGGTNVFFDSRRNDLIEFILNTRVTCLYISRMHVEGLVQLDGAERLRDVRIVSAGSPIPRRIRAALEARVSPHVFVRYGATETGVVTVAGPGEHGEDANCGKPLAGVDLRITDDDGADLPHGQAGRIAIRVPGMACGYLDNPQQTAGRFRDGWFFPGDLGRLTPDGRLIVLGRADDMIIMNGLNIFPREIETVLESHPGIAGAVAFPLESRVHGQIPVAAVELADPAGPTPAELLRWTKGLLGLKAPRKIACVATLPRNSQGKIMVAELRPLFAVRETGASVSPHQPS